MILADKIINERKKNGWSQEELAEMLDVSRQSVSKWEGAQSIPDLQKIVKMAEIFSVSTDYLLKDELEPDNTPVYHKDSVDHSSSIRKITMEEAAEYISIRKHAMPRIALGVMLCITCPVILIFLVGLQQSNLIGLSEGVVTAIGLLFLFAQVGYAVFSFIINGSRLSKYGFLEQQEFETEYGVDGMAKEKLAENQAINTRALTTGVLLCVLGCVPLVICSVLHSPKATITSMVCLLLIAIGVAVYLFISICAVNASYKVLLQTEDYSPEAKKKNKKLEGLTKIYWLAVVVIFLAVSFLTQRWDRTWIIWAVSGVLYALIRVVAESLVRTDD